LQRLNQRRFRADAGVTLVEMMVVIVIIGLITAIVVINVLPAQDTARVEKAKADIHVLEQALELYRLQFQRYPSMEEGLQVLAAAPPTAAGAARAEPFVRHLPNDPWGRPYLYVVPGEHGAYDLYTLGRDAQQGGEGVDADIGNWQ
jgi:general secretion pathway protein G